jgi:hypothetical protein
VFTARYVLPTQCIYVFCVDLRTNSDYFAKFRKSTVNFIMLLHPSVSPHGTARLPLEEFFMKSDI